MSHMDGTAIGNALNLLANNIGGFNFYSFKTTRSEIDPDQRAGSRAIFYTSGQQVPIIVQIDWQYSTLWYGGYDTWLDNKFQDETSDISIPEDSAGFRSYIQATGSAENYKTLSAGVVTQVDLDTVISSYGNGISLNDGGIKVSNSGTYLVSGSAYIYASTNATAKGVYVKKGASFADSSEIMATLIERPSGGSGIGGCIPTSTRLIELSAGDIVYLCARSVSADGRVYESNSGTYLLLMKLI